MDGGRIPRLTHSTPETMIRFDLQPGSTESSDAGSGHREVGSTLSAMGWCERCRTEAAQEVQTLEPAEASLLTAVSSLLPERDVPTSGMLLGT